MHTTLWRLSQVLLSGRETGGQRSGVSGSQDCGWGPTHTGTISLGPEEAMRGLRVLEEAVFVLSLSTRAGGLGWGPLHRVLSGQGNKNLVCGKKPVQAGLRLLQRPRQRARLCQGLGELEHSFGLALTTALAATRRLPVR